ncbi:MAG TPA: hypothetical protein VIT22_08025 [Pseudoxanthomonas sp.]
MVERLESQDFNFFTDSAAKDLLMLFPAVGALVAAFPWMMRTGEACDSSGGGLGARVARNSVLLSEAIVRNGA